MTHKDGTTASAGKALPSSGLVSQIAQARLLPQGCRPARIGHVATPSEEMDIEGQLVSGRCLGIGHPLLLLWFDRRTIREDC